MSAFADRAMKERFAAASVETLRFMPGQFAAYIRGQFVKWGKVVHATGVKVE